MNLFDLVAKITIDDSEYESGVQKASQSGESLASKLKGGLVSAGTAAAKGIAVVGTAAAGAVGGLLALESSTEEYRVAQGRLNTAFEAAGYGADTAQQAYSAFYGILGDTDTATEASQLLATLAENEEDVATWTNIAAGVNGTFGDSLPIEGLIESANETAKVGTVTGSLADALNWAGISEDDFNAKLAACTSESERNQLIMNTLSGTYDEASAAFYRNNEALVESRNNQMQLDAALASLGDSVSEIKNRVLTEFMPAISNVATALSGMLTGVQGADQQFVVAVQGLVQKAVEQLPAFLNMGIQIITALLSGIIQSVPTLLAAVPQIVSQFAAAFATLLPQLLSMGSQIITQIATGIETGLPQLVAKIPLIVQSILDYITQNLPAMLEKGVEILTSIMNGIINAIPQLVGALPQVISAIVDFIISSLPQIIESGVQLLVNFAQGIISAIPQLVGQIPQIISAIVSTIASNLPQILQSGVTIIQSLIEGILSLIGSVISAAGEIASSIINKIMELPGRMISIGGQIIQGLINGIKSGVSRVIGAISDVVSSAINAAKRLFGINSPSRVFRDEIGEMLGLGLSEGIDDSTSAAVNAAKKMARDVAAAGSVSLSPAISSGSMDFGTASVSYANSGLGKWKANNAQSTERDINIVVQSVLDGKVIGETAYKYSRNKQRAYGM